MTAVQEIAPIDAWDKALQAYVYHKDVETAAEGIIYAIQMLQSPDAVQIFGETTVRSAQVRWHAAYAFFLSSALALQATTDRETVNKEVTRVARHLGACACILRKKTMRMWGAMLVLHRNP